MLRIRNISVENTEFVTQLYAMENWNYLLSDIRRYIGWEPKGCFAAEVDGKPVGHVFSISYDHLGWIGLLRVDPDYRNRGIGSELMRKAISYLRSKGVKVIKLEAVQKAVNLYRRLGFKEEFESLRLRALIQNISIIENTSVMTSSDQAKIRTMKSNDITAIIKLDALYFGASRARILKTLFQEFPNLCFVAEASDELIGYLMCRNSTPNTYKIGPWVCDPKQPEVAEKLLVRCLTNLGENNILTLGIPVINDQAVQITRKFGFQHVETCKRMFLGQKQVKDTPKGIFAIGGSEKG